MFLEPRWVTIWIHLKTSASVRVKKKPYFRVDNFYNNYTVRVEKLILMTIT